MKNENPELSNEIWYILVGNTYQEEYITGLRYWYNDNKSINTDVINRSHNSKHSILHFQEDCFLHW